MDRITREQFIEYLRNDLNHLYNPTRLRQSPLASFLGVVDRFDSASVLRNILVNAVDELKPDNNEPSQERAWRMYESLFYCYVQQLGQQAVADQLGLSTRQLRREQRAALEPLSDILCRKYQLQDCFTEDSQGSTTELPVSTSLDQDLEWLRNAPLNQTTELNQALPGVLELAAALASQYYVQVNAIIEANLPPVAIHPVAFDQILLNLLAFSFKKGAGSQVDLSTQIENWDILISITAQKIGLPEPADPTTGSNNLEIAQYVLELSHGSFEVNEQAQSLQVSLRLPLVELVPILAMDDNLDLLELFKRYTQGTKYHIIQESDPTQVFSSAERHQPQLILLDIMMPEIDGWKMLGRLRQHPVTSHVPVIICTILPQEELALALGANAFLKKPVNRQAFLAALDQQMENLRSSSG